MTVPPIARSPKSRILNKAGWMVMLVLAVLMFVLASRYLTLNPEVYFPEQRAVYMAHTMGIILHIVGAMLATIIGPFQFLPKSRSGQYLNVHRWLGRTYLVGVLFGGLGGLYMARLAYGGLPARLGFAALAILWLFSGFMAYKHIRNKEIQRHRQWMVRNYALTFAAVTLRLWQVVFQVAGVDFIVGYVTVAWLCWIPNLIVAEWIVSRMRPSQRHATTV
jgi:Predicted membrane protein (DUF2306)